MADSKRGENRSPTLEYKRADGSKVVAPLAEAAAEAIADGSPWRRFHWYPGQKNYCGTYWCATEHKGIDYESRLELARLVMRDFDPNVRRIAGQPFHLTAEVRGTALERVPDYLVLTDTEVVVVDVKNASDLLEPEVQQVMALTSEVVQAIGWRHEVVSDPPPVRYANIKFLAGYRREWLFAPDVLARVSECAAEMSGTSMKEIIMATNLVPRQAFPAVMHLLWRGVLTADLDVRLSKSAALEWSR